MRRWTIRGRLTAVYGGLFFVAGALLLAVTYFLVQQRLGERGDIAVRAPIAKQFVEGPTTPTGGTVVVDGQEMSIQKAVVAIEAEQKRYRAETMNSLLTQGGIALVVVGAVAVTFGWLLSARALRPIHAITETARRIASADGVGRGLHERIALDGPPDEVRELADTFDIMLERLDRSFDGQRRFVANASHELRTPLALNRALVEVAVTRPGVSSDVVALGEALLSVNARHERLIDGLLTLAESENTITEPALVDLGDVTAHVAKLADAADVDVRFHVEPTLVTGDAVLLERLVQNLVENAVRHNLRSGGWVSVETFTAGLSAVLRVANTGREIAAFEVDTLFRPFRRLGTERVGGSVGLGLSIVRAVARAHGGEVSAEARPGGGLIVTVHLPLASQPHRALVDAGVTR